MPIKEPMSNAAVTHPFPDRSSWKTGKVSKNPPKLDSGGAVVIIEKVASLDRFQAQPIWEISDKDISHAFATQNLRLRLPSRFECLRRRVEVSRRRDLGDRAGRVPFCRNRVPAPCFHHLGLNR